MRAVRAFLFLAFAAFPARGDDARNASVKRAFDKLSEEFGMPLLARPAAAAPLAADAVDHSVKPDEESLRKSVDELVRKSEHSFSGVVALYKLESAGPRAVFELTYGHENAAANIANSPETSFNFASMGKMITTVLIFRLIDARALKLESTLGEVHPDLVDTIAARSALPLETVSKINIRQLLTHTSGLGDFFGADFDRHKDEIAALREYPRFFQPRPPPPEHGSKEFSYSNAGFITLGLIVEKIMGDDFFAIAGRFMKDAGMVRSGYPSKTSLPPGTAVGYTPDGHGSVRSNDHELPRKGSSAGGGYASARDWARFAWGLSRGTLVSESSREQMFAIQLLPDPRAPDFGMGLGFVVAHVGGDVMAGHNGGFPGVSTSLQFFLKKGYAIVVLSNRDPADVGAIAKFIADKVPTLP